MGFLEFMLGKRLIDDEISRFSDNLQTIAQYRANSPKRRKQIQQQIARNWPAFLSVAKKDLEHSASAWIGAGDFKLLPSGDIVVPDLPDAPGIMRIDVVGPEQIEFVTLLSQHQSLRADESTWGADPEGGAHLLAGGRFAAFYIDAVKVPGGRFDLTSEANRQSVVRSIERHAEGTGRWLVQDIEGRNALIPNLEAMEV